MRSPLRAWRRWLARALLALATLGAALAIARPEAVAAVPIERAERRQVSSAPRGDTS